MSWRTFFQGSLMALGVFASAQAMALPGLVLGRFSSQDNADARRAEVEFVMREPVRVVAASVDGRQLYRVVVVAEGLSLEQLRSRALAGGLGRGWRINTEPSLRMFEKLLDVWRRDPELASLKRGRLLRDSSQDRTVACS